MSAPPPPTDKARREAAKTVAARVEDTAYRIAVLLAAGWRQKDIATHLGVHVNTVSNHARRTGFRRPRKTTKKEET